MSLCVLEVCSMIVSGGVMEGERLLSSLGVCTNNRPVKFTCSVQMGKNTYNNAKPRGI
jgi:hypothetical protein